MAGRRGFFDHGRLPWLAAAGHPLARLAAAMDFELFRPGLETALSGRCRLARGGRIVDAAILEASGEGRPSQGDA
jgi:hypothetical protein